jgi:glycosyltransferase involved in cell wall biosynthesis
MLVRAVESALNQTFSNFEIIIVDDGTLKENSILVRYSNHPKIKVIKNSSNMGAAKSRNRGIEAAKGRYISFLDDDDEYMPSFLLSTYNHLEGTPDEIGLSCCSVKFIDYRVNGKIEKSERLRKILPIHDNKIMLFLEFLSIGTGFGVTIKSSCLKTVGFFDTEFKFVEDSDLFYRFLINGYIPAILPDYEVIIHNHNEAKLSCLATHSLRIMECKALLNKYNYFLEQHPPLKNQLLHHIDNLKNELTGNSGDYV